MPIELRGEKTLRQGEKGEILSCGPETHRNTHGRAKTPVYTNRRPPFVNVNRWLMPELTIAPFRHGNPPLARPYMGPFTQRCKHTDMQTHTCVCARTQLNPQAEGKMAYPTNTPLARNANH